MPWVRSQNIHTDPPESQEERHLNFSGSSARSAPVSAMPAATGWHFWLFAFCLFVFCLFALQHTGLPVDSAAAVFTIGTALDTAHNVKLHTARNIISNFYNRSLAIGILSRRNIVAPLALYRSLFFMNETCFTILRLFWTEFHWELLSLYTLEEFVTVWHYRLALRNQA